MENLRILLTGSSGFFGQHMLERLLELPDCQVALASRGNGSGQCENFILGDFGRATDFSQAVQAKDIVIHCAGKAHTRERTEQALSAFREVNVRATVKLAKQAAHAGVKRFIFLSSIGVLGNRTGRPFQCDDTPNPIEIYAKSKHSAERHLRRIGQMSGMEVVIIRPSLIIGPSAPGNFGAFCRLIDSGVPLPLGSIQNLRSFVSVWTLVNLIEHCLKAEQLPPDPLLVKEDPDLSTPDLLRMIAEAKGRRARVFACPPSVLSLASRLVGKSDLYEKLTSSLQIDDHVTRETLAWYPPLTIADSLKRCFS